MFGTVGLPEIFIVLFILLILFGPKRIPEFMKGIGGGIRELKNSLRGDRKNGNDTGDAEV